MPCWLQFYSGRFSNPSRAGFIHFLFFVGSFSYTSRAGFFYFFFISGVSLTHPVLVSFLFGDFLVHIPCWLHFLISGVSLTHPVLVLLIFLGVSLLHPELDSFLCTESPTHLVQASFLSGEFLLHIPCCINFCFQGSLSYTSRAGFIFMRGVSLTHPVLPLFFIWGVSLTHPVLASFLFGEFLLHIPCWLNYFYLGNFSYTSRAGFIFIWGVSLTHPMLASFLFGEFLLHTPCWHHFYFIFYLIIIISGVSLTHPMLVLFNFLAVSLSHPELNSFLCTPSIKKSDATKKNSWVDKDLRKSPREKKCFDQNTVPWNAQKNRTTNTWVEEDISKFPKTRRH